MAEPSPAMTLAGRTQTLPGPGLHSGVPCAVILAPAAPGAGLAFQLADAPDAPDIPARAAAIVPAERCTALGAGGRQVRVVEHLLAACALAALDDALLLVEGGEVPAADGSAAPFLELIAHVGMVAQGVPRRTLGLAEPVEVSGGTGSGWKIRGEPASTPAFAFRFRGGGKLDGAEVAFVPGRDDPAAVASARTFCFEREIVGLRARGLGKGVGIESVLVLSDAGEPVHGERMPLEAVRHKLLDLIGDLALAGGPICAKIVAEGSGHAAHAEFLRRLLPHLRPGEAAEHRA